MLRSRNQINDLKKMNSLFSIQLVTSTWTIDKTDPPSLPLFFVCYEGTNGTQYLSHVLLPQYSDPLRIELTKNSSAYIIEPSCEKPKPLNINALLLYDSWLDFTTIGLKAHHCIHRYETLELLLIFYSHVSDQFVYTPTSYVVRFLKVKLRGAYTLSGLGFPQVGSTSANAK